jgi:hypothetical protein
MYCVFSHLGAPPLKKCPETALAGNLDEPRPLPGITPSSDPEKIPTVTTTSPGLTWSKVLIGGLVVYAAGKVFGLL